jgi:hypothetical protein
MHEETIKKVAGVLTAWNPLGEQADTVNDLDGYSTEAIDILSAINPKQSTERIAKIIDEVLSEAFYLSVDYDEAYAAAKEIRNILKSKVG